MEGIYKHRSQVRNLIALGDIEKAINLSHNLFTTLSLNDLNDDLAVISARYHEYKREKRLKIISTEEEEVKLNRISHSILQLFEQDQKNRKNNRRPIIIEKTKSLKIPSQEDIKKFGLQLKREIDLINHESDIVGDVYIPLNIQVIDEKRPSASSDFIEYFLKDKESSLILVIGEPGSGKSYTLRKISKKILEKTETIETIPIYINLKSWSHEEYSNIANNSLLQYIYKTLIESKNPIIEDFARKYFYSLYKTGKFLFLLDSFDEIPAILDTHNYSDIVELYSNEIMSFVGTNRCVVASREFKRPSGKILPDKTLLLRPFTDECVYKFFEKNIDRDYIKYLLGSPSFRMLSKNPFTASLIIDFVRSRNRLPKNQVELFENYIESRIYRELIKRAKEKNLNDVITAATHIATVMFDTPPYGLDAPVNGIKHLTTKFNIGETLNILAQSRIARIGKGRFSFSHRRISEYFIVLDLLARDNLPLDDIIYNGRYRDALVAYCEIAEDEQAKKILQYCVEYLQTTADNPIEWATPSMRNSIFSMRFLSEGFKTRKHLLYDFYKVIYNCIYRWSQSECNLILRKYAIEATVLLDNWDAERIIDLSLPNRKRKVSSTEFYLINSIIDSSIYLKRFSKSLNKKIITYYLNRLRSSTIGPIHPKRLNELNKVLSISPAFVYVRRFLRGIIIEQIAYFIIFTCLSFFFAILFFKNPDRENIIFLSISLLMFSSNFLINPSKYSISYLLYAFTLIDYIALGIIISIFLLCILFMYLYLWIAPLFLVISFFLLFSAFFNFFKQKHFNKKNYLLAISRVEDGMNRKIIEEDFFNLHSRFRSDYIFYIKEKKITPTGNWKNGVIPNDNDDFASGLLADLEEKWLGLN